MPCRTSPRWLVPGVFLAVLLVSSPCAAESLSCRLSADGLVVTGETEYRWGSFDLHLSPWAAASPAGLGLGLVEAYATTSWGPLDLTLGRRLTALGPGRYGWPILGPHGQGLAAEGYDQVGYAFSWPGFLGGDLDYRKFYAYVPDPGFRALLGQRVTWEWRSLTVGFTEAALLDADAPGYFYLPAPFIPVYFYQFLGYHVFDIPGINDAANCAVDFDLAWRPVEGLRLYAEYYMDDRPWPRLDEDNHWVLPQPGENPWRVGYQAGLSWDGAFGRRGLALFAEYTRIDQFTYTAYGDPSLNWTYRGLILGDPLGPDADRLNIELVLAGPDGRRWGLALARERHGEGEIGDQWTPVPGQTEVFLTGVVEITDRLSVTAARISDPSEYRLTAGFARIENAGHVPGERDGRFELSLECRLSFMPRQESL